jgi:hypothetical protein
LTVRPTQHNQGKIPLESDLCEQRCSSSSGCRGCIGDDTLIVLPIMGKITQQLAL